MVRYKQRRVSIPDWTASHDRFWARQIASLQADISTVHVQKQICKSDKSLPRLGLHLQVDSHVKNNYSKNFEWKFRIQKIFETCHDFGITFWALSRGAKKWCRGQTKVFIRCLLAPREGLLRVFQVFWAVFSHSSAVSALKIAEITKFMYFSVRKNVELEEKLSKGVLLGRFLNIFWTFFGHFWLFFSAIFDVFLAIFDVL